MEISDLLVMSWAILQWVVDWIWILCLVLFIGIMIKTFLDVSKKVIDTSAPGLRNLWGSRRRG